MPYKIFTFPIMVEDEELNKFLRSHKIIEVEKHLIISKNNAYWTFCIQYLDLGVTPVPYEKKEKIDYRFVLNEAHFSIFSHLRMIRKKLAEEDAVPAYAVFTDSELADISKLEEINEKNILSIQGIGVKKVEKYGAALCKMWQENSQSEIQSQRQ